MADAWSMSATGVELAEQPACRLTMLRLGHGEGNARRSVEAAIGLALPAIPNTAAGDDDARAIWMGPGEWMVIGASVDATVAEEAASGTTVLAVDVSAGRFAIDVVGDAALDFLAKACSLDLHPDVFAVDRTAMSLFAQVPVVIDHIERPRYRLYFDVSFRTYLRTWFADALVEFT